MVSALEQTREERPSGGAVVAVLASAPLALGDAGQDLFDVLTAAGVGGFTALLAGDATTHDGAAFMGDGGNRFRFEPAVTQR